MSKKLEEKQARRRIQEEREAAQKSAARKRNMMTWGVVLVVVAIVGTLIYLESKKDETGVVSPRGDCTVDEDFNAPDEATHVDDGTNVPYAQSPPTFGDHYAEWIDPPGFFSTEAEPVERFVHNMEHGQIVFWYRDDAPQTVKDQLEDLVVNDPEAIALLARPYEDISTDYTFVMTAWGHSQSCPDFDADVIDAFRTAHQGKGPENVGIPTHDG